MASFRLSRFLVGVFALCYVSMSAAIVVFSSFSASNTSMAAGFVPAVAPACPTPSADGALMENAAGTLQSISGSKLVIVPLQGQGSSSSINATYSSTTRITQIASITTAALKTNTDVFIQAIPNATNTSYTASEVHVRLQDSQSCFGSPPPNTLSTPPAGTPPAGAPRRTASDCLSGAGPGQASRSVTCIAGTVQQLSGTTLTVKDRQAKIYTITLTSTTKITQETLATSTALKPKAFVVVRGTKKNDGSVAALRITVQDSSIAVG